MPWITTRKTRYGFEYSVGTIPVARAKWVNVAEVGTQWQVQVATLTPSDTNHTAAVFDIETMPLSEVMAYIHDRLARPEPAPEID